MSSENGLLKNDELWWAKLPDKVDETAIFNFAMTFNSYIHFAPFDWGMEHERPRFEESDTLTYTRHVLFMAARGARHMQNDGHVQTYETLLPIFQHLLPDAPPRADELEDNLGPLHKIAGII